MIFCLVVLLAAMVDEVSSAINAQVQSSIVNEFIAIARGMDYSDALAVFGSLTVVSYILLALVPFYKALADKLGRKFFLVINTAGMSLGLLLCFVSQNLLTYFIGYALVTFFVQHDMQIIYLFEAAPKEKRARVYGSIKGIATLSIVLVPILRNVFMGADATKWRGVFLICPKKC